VSGMIPARLATALADRYRIERELGAGGMATVYLADDLKHDRKVAIKVLRPELAAVIGAERFLSEIKTTANLQHPHILPLFDSGAADSFLYYVMPFVQGISLRDRMTREKQLPIAEAVRIASEIAAALDYAHRHGIIHRDIKPENILLHDGSALVADFGIALAASKAGTRMTETGMSLGTPQYMSPEQAMGERELDARSDVYALGCVAYEMLTGEPPFSGPTAQAIVAKVMTAEPAEVTSLRKTVPEHVADAVHTALQKLPADRFESARAFADALGGSAAESGGRTTRTRARSSKPRAGARVPMPGVLLGAAGLLLGALGMLALRRDDAAPAPAARVLLQLRAGQELRAQNYPSLDAAPDGSGVIYHGPGANSQTQLWLRRWDQLAAQRLSQSEGESCCAAFSPSGDTIAYLSAPRRLHLLPLTGGVPTTLPDLGLASMTDMGGGLDWGADGRLYAVGPEGLLRIDARRATKEVVARPDTARGELLFLWPHLLPGAKAALVTVVGKQTPTDPARASIGVADFGTGRVEIVVQGVRAIYAPTGHLLVVKPNGVLWAVPFDVRALRSSGTARELPDTVAARFGNLAPGAADLALDGRGTLSYVAGGEGAFQTTWVDRTGSWRPLGDGPDHTTVDAIAFSPDGRRLVQAFGGEDRNLHLWSQPAGGGPRVRLTFDGSVNSRARWRPGTNDITYLSDRESLGNPKLRLYERDAGGQGAVRRFATGDPRAVGGQTWSPDGKWLVFRTDDQEPGGGDIMAIRPGIDTAARALVATPAEELSPEISPNGRWLAYTSNESGRREVFVRPFPETTEARYQISTAGGITPVWSRDGRELFFIDDAERMIAVPVIPGASFQTGAPAVLFPARDYYSNPFHQMFTLSPDGRQFVMSRRRAGNDFGLVVVFNFLDELKRRMAAR
jgi:eukaryotic-like serine/threonine-protein kinase